MYGRWVTCVLLAGVAAAQPPAERRILVVNPSERVRAEIVRASLPFAPGVAGDDVAIAVAGQVVPAATLLRWRDGSRAVVQAHVPVRLKVKEQRWLDVELVPAAAPDALAGDWLWPDVLPLHTEVADPWGQVYRADWVADDTLCARSTAAVRVRRFRATHRREGAAYFGLVAYLTTFRGERRAELTVVLDNRASGHVAGPVLGPARFRSFALVTESDQLRFAPRFISENGLRPPQLRRSGGYRQWLLAPSDQLYLGDRTAKAFRLDLWWADADEPSAPPSGDAPVLAWPDLDWLRRTRAFSSHGGPGPGGDDELARTQYLAWRQRGHFGAFAGHGDSRDAAAQGTPRNGPMSLHNVLRWRSFDLLRAAETRALQQTLRPTPGSKPRLPAEMTAFRQGLGRRAINSPHGFTPLDYEHFSVDLLFDYYWLTGDELARDELARCGRGLRELWARLPFLTSRGEGWCFQAAAQIARATNDQGLLAAAVQRYEDVLVPVVGHPPQAFALQQPPHPQAFGSDVSFDAPWQMAALVHGLHAVFMATGDVRVRDTAVDVAVTMAGAGWLEGVGPKYLVSATDPAQYTMPIGHGPLQGTALMEIGAFVVASELTGDDERRTQLMDRAAAIAEPNLRTADPRDRADRWLQLYLDRREGR